MTNPNRSAATEFLRSWCFARFGKRPVRRTARDAVDVLAGRLLPTPEVVAYRHVLHTGPDRVDQLVVVSESPDNPWGGPGVGHPAEYSVTTDALGVIW